MRLPWTEIFLKQEEWTEKCGDKANEDEQHLVCNL